MTVYNICSPYDYNVNHKDFSLLMTTQKKTLEQLANRGINFIDMAFYENELWFRINVLFRHVLPALFVDFILVLLKKDPM